MGHRFICRLWLREGAFFRGAKDDIGLRLRLVGRPSSLKLDAAESRFGRSVPRVLVIELGRVGSIFNGCCGVFARVRIAAR